MQQTVPETRMIALIAAVTLGASVLASPLRGAEPDAQAVEFFEKRIRPVLVQHCYECHNSIDKPKGGLALDHKQALLAGGDSGAPIVPGKPKESLLIAAIRHEKDLKMPSKAPKLSDEVIRGFEKWVELGAPDPRLTKPTKEEIEKKLPWPQVRDERAKWWSFQPLREQPAAKADDPAWDGSELDRFVYRRMRVAGLAPQPEASPRVLARRVHLILTGLPPSPQVVEAFAKDPSAQAYERMVDSLLASQAFGERWARHWMDWYRYAETHGSEGDPTIPFAGQYRGYLIRALNADVPYNQLLREHLAGDLLTNPRVNRDLDINESAIGPAHLRMVPHGFSVTDAYGEQITFTDNQIDVISKAMLGVTVSCARCHDHKFDPISQKDFYRFYGILVSSRPSTVLIDTKERQETNKAAMAALKEEIRAALAGHWLSQVDAMPAGLEAGAAQFAKRQAVTDPLGLWAALREAKPQDYAPLIESHRAELKKIKDDNAAAIVGAAFYLDLRAPANADKWFISGNSTAATVSPAGSFAIAPGGTEAVRGIYPAGIYSHLLSDRHAAVLSTGNHVARGKQTMMRVAGQDSRMRVPIRNYPLSDGLLHTPDGLSSPTLQWRGAARKWRYWQGDLVHYELRTSKEMIANAGNADRSWFGVAELIAGDLPMRDQGASLLDLLEEGTTITDRASLDAAYGRALRLAVTRWGKGAMNDTEAQFLNAFVLSSLLTNQLDRLPESIAKLIARYRELEAGIPLPRRAPGVLDAEPVDQPLLVRGEYRQESEPVRRGFLELYGDRPFAAHGSGRLELAEAITSPANTLKSRVLVNRLWAYVFGRGLVASTDNLGRLGTEPTHPELLDHLALTFERDGWSIKQSLRRMVLSRAFRSTSLAASQARRDDPDNTWLSYYTPRRLDAEAIMDSINQLEGQSRRAVYGRVLRNRLDPFLATFNAPIPTTTVSHRNHIDVPAQALTMMNGQLVDRAVRAWSDRIAQDSSLLTPRDKIAALVMQAYGRPATERELEQLLAYHAGIPVVEDELRKLTAERDRLATELAAAKVARDALLLPVRKRLQDEVDRRNEQAAKDGPSRPVDLKPAARWDFKGDARDAIGAMHGTLKGKAKIESGALVLEGGFMLTEPIARPLGARTLEVLVQLGGLDQRGGGAMTLQTADGNEFDSVVYGEAVARRWLAGSDVFKRTSPLDGAAEAEAVERPVRITLVYEEGGTIRAYRDGKPYGEPYRKAALRAYKAGEAHVAFGLRHGTGVAEGRMLAGRIHEARLYDRALSAEEVAASVSGNLKLIVTREMIVSALSGEQKQQLEGHETGIRRLEAAAGAIERDLKAQESPRARNSGYYGIAHALLNSKEFIYVH